MTVGVIELKLTNGKSKNNIHLIAKRLDALLAKEMEYIPYKKGNTVYIQNCRIVKKDSHVFLVYKGSELIANCFYKKSAFAIAQRILHGKTYEDIMLHDRSLEKNYNDSIFYMHTITNTNSSIKFDIASTRFDISKTKIQEHLSAITTAAKWH